MLHSQKTAILIQNINVPKDIFCHFNFHCLYFNDSSKEFHAVLQQASQDTVNENQAHKL
jgi:hypothetical protein